MIKKPNLFEFATSELSQDAFLCYLLSYAKKEYENSYPNEYEIGNKFLNKVLKECFKRENIPKVETLEIKKQNNNIDILLILNEKIDPYYIIIEDKTETSEHSEQIQRYKNKLMERIGDIEEEKIKTLYFKTGDESFFKLEESSSKKNRIMRENFLELYYDKKGEVLYQGNNYIITEYFERLKQIDDDVKSFKEVNLKEEKFTWNQTIGFYNALDNEFFNCKELNKIYGKEKLIHSNWEYVPNQNGGFLCYYFSGVLNCEKYGYYLQIEKINVKTQEEIEEDKNEIKNSRNTRWTYKDVPYSDITLVVKVWSDDKNIEILRKSLDVFKEKYKDKFEEKRISMDEKRREFLKPNKFSSGKWMTLLLINDYIVLNGNNTINIKKTANKIREYQILLKNLEKELKILEK